MNLLTRINQIALANPSVIAYDELGTTHTYADLKQFSDQLATWLDQQNLPAHQPILFYGDHQFEMLAGFLGALKAGHPYIPVETGTALPRLTSILTTGQPGLIIAIDEFPTEITPSAEVVTLADITTLGDDQLDYQLTHPVTGDDLVYILFTSGTTGSPKGVQITHDNLTSFGDWMLSDDFKLPTHQTFLGQPPYSFDLSGMFWLPALLSAGTIKAIPSAVVQNFGQLFQVVPNLDLNVFVSTPSFADMLMLSPEFNTEHMPGLNYFLFCGEELTVSTAKRLQERFPTAHIFNTYGPTEATVAVTSIEISQEMIENLKRLPVGKVKAHTTTSIWDDDQMLTEPNQQGEIIIAGDSVAKGYLNNPEKTAQNFFELNGQRAYRTGDAGMIDENGLHYVLGRMDFQIKLHGFRIELDEVRSSLEASPLIKQAVAVPKYDQDHKVKQLIAYIIPEASVTSEGTDFAKEMRQSLTGNIMDYMMPNQFIKVSEFPMSPNGKIAIKQMIAEANQS